MVSRAIAFCLTAVVISVVALGCGGDSAESSKSGTITTSSLTRSQFAERADEICSTGSEKLLERLSIYMKEHESGSQTEAELVAEAIHVTVLPALEDQFDEIESLGAPKGDRHEVEALLAALREGVVAAKKRREMSLVANISPDFRHSGKLARQYGLDACAYG